MHSKTKHELKGAFIHYFEERTMLTVHIDALSEEHPAKHIYAQIYGEKMATALCKLFQAQKLFVQAHHEHSQPRTTPYFAHLVTHDDDVFAAMRLLGLSVKRDEPNIVPLYEANFLLAEQRIWRKLVNDDPEVLKR